jgi:hypothetical protein
VGRGGGQGGKEVAALTQDQSPRWRLVMIFFEGVVNGRRGVAAHARHPMAVGVERELDRGVAERGLDGLYVDERYTAKLLV